MTFGGALFFTAGIRLTYLFISVKKRIWKKILIGETEM